MGECNSKENARLDDDKYYVFVQACTHDISETYHIRFIFYFYCCCHCFVVKRDMKFKCNDITPC